MTGAPPAGYGAHPGPGSLTEPTVCFTGDFARVRNLLFTTAALLSLR